LSFDEDISNSSFTASGVYNDCSVKVGLSVSSASGYPANAKKKITHINLESKNINFPTACIVPHNRFMATPWITRFVDKYAPKNKLPLSKSIDLFYTKGSEEFYKKIVEKKLEDLEMIINHSKFFRRTWIFFQGNKVSFNMWSSFRSNENEVVFAKKIISLLTSLEKNTYFI
jgi:hypothetical protein